MCEGGGHWLRNVWLEVLLLKNAMCEVSKRLELIGEGNFRNYRRNRFEGVRGENRGIDVWIYCLLLSWTPS